MLPTADSEFNLKCGRFRVLLIIFAVFLLGTVLYCVYELVTTEVGCGIALVTAVSSNHYAASRAFLQSAQKAVSMASHRVVVSITVYDLGLTPNERQTLENDFPRYMFKRFPYEQFPSYYNVQVAAGEYAWKPAILQIEYAQSQCHILWMDAGDSFKRARGALKRIADRFDEVPVQTSRSTGNVGQWIHHGMQAKLGFIGNGSTPMCNGAFVGLRHGDPVVQTLVNEWAACAADKTCIAPEGSSRANHRQDQAALTLLMHRHGIAGECSTNNLAIYGVSLHNDGSG